MSILKGQKIINDKICHSKKIRKECLKQLHCKLKILINNCVVHLVHELFASWAYLCGKMYISYKDPIHGLKQISSKSLTHNCYLLLLERNCYSCNVQSFNCCVFLMLCNNNGGRQWTCRVIVFNYTLYV